MGWPRYVLLVAVAAAACGDSGGDVPPAVDAGSTDGGGAPDADTPVDGSVTRPGTYMIGPPERRARLIVPSAHDGVTPLPLVFLLHGLGATSAQQDLLFQFTGEAGRRGFYLVLPEGTTNSSGLQFWNATPECCDFEGSGVDDEGYLRGLVDEVVADYTVDESRIYFTGHSNGGFMSYRMACHMSDRVAAILSLAGSGFLDESLCMNTEPVSVLQIHGDMDGTIPYLAGTTIVDRWVTRNGCTAASAETLPAIDADSAVDGDETTRTHYEAGCAAGTEVELWTIVGGGHIPIVTDTFRAEGLDWLLSQTK